MFIERFKLNSSIKFKKPVLSKLLEEENCSTQHRDFMILFQKPSKKTQIGKKKNILSKLDL